MASGTVDKVKGAAKEAVGKVTGDKRTEAEGQTDQVKGKAKNATDNVTESAKGVQDSLRKSKVCSKFSEAGAPHVAEDLMCFGRLAPLPYHPPVPSAGVEGIVLNWPSAKEG